ncbi:MAG: hypothetical protein ACR2PZ_16490 [Pseudomonadales bacterium]
MPRSTVRGSRTGSGRLAKTIVLAALALAAGLYWLAGESDVAAQNIAQYALTSLIWLAAPVVLAALVFGLFVGLRRLLRGRGKRSDD